MIHPSFWWFRIPIRIPKNEDRDTSINSLPLCVSLSGSWCCILHFFPFDEERARRSADGSIYSIMFCRCIWIVFIPQSGEREREEEVECVFARPVSPSFSIFIWAAEGRGLLEFFRRQFFTSSAEQVERGLPHVTSTELRAFLPPSNSVTEKSILQIWGIFYTTPSVRASYMEAPKPGSGNGVFISRGKILLCIFSSRVSRSTKEITVWRADKPSCGFRS